MFTDLIITADRFEHDITEGGIVVANKGDLKPYQTVVAIGNAVRDIAVNDKVMVDFSAYAEHKIPTGSVKEKMDVDNPVVNYHIPWVAMCNELGDETMYIRISVNNVEYVFEGEEVEDKPVIFQVKKPDILLN
jgi:hypothetical protein